ncbi:MAG TPA: tetratricopeptide repeat protein [Gammaproteobacteria bacterium]
MGIARIACCCLLAIWASNAFAAKPKTTRKLHAVPAATAPAASAAQPAPPPATITEPVAVTKPAPPATIAPPVATITAPAAATVAVPAADPNLTLVSGMASAGAPRIALEIMDRDQPDAAQDLVGWMAWERERIYIYQTARAWKAVIERAGKMPAEATPDFHRWESMQAADAWLHLGDGAKALSLVQPLVWDAKSPPDPATLAQLRQLIIRSYTVSGKLDDAQAAVIRYREDYPKDTGAWPLLEARLYLRFGQPQSALDALQDVKGDEAEMLSLLAALRSGQTAPGDVLGQAVHIGSDSQATVQKQVRAWLIAAEAADMLKNPVARIQALQDALGLQPTLIEQDEVFSLTPDMLWDAYESYGEDLGNQLQLVVGDDQAWFVAASNAYDSKPVDALALMAVVAYDVQGSTNAAGGMEPEAAKAEHMRQGDVAHGQFAALIQKQRHGDAVLRHLYLDSKRFKGSKTIPATVRYILVDDVMEQPDIPLASQLMQGLDTPPPTEPGEKPGDPAVADAAWQLKRAHVFILGGDPEQGIASLKKLIDGKAPIDGDGVLQELFALQTLHRDKEAIPLFEALLKTDLKPEQRRQMLYWTADSYKAIGDYAKAAELYLRSAMLPGPFTMDPWAQTARYQAAQMLAQAGYLDDARKLYDGLLSATNDPAQQAVLNHDLQQLLLMTNKPGTELR